MKTLQHNSRSGDTPEAGELEGGSSKSARPHAASKRYMLAMTGSGIRQWATTVQVCACLVCKLYIASLFYRGIRVDHLNPRFPLSTES